MKAVASLGSQLYQKRQPEQFVCSTSLLSTIPSAPTALNHVWPTSEKPCIAGEPNRQYLAIALLIDGIPRMMATES